MEKYEYNLGMTRNSHTVNARSGDTLVYLVDISASFISCSPGWSWNKLSSLYSESPLLNLDKIALSSSTNEAVKVSDDREDIS